MALSPELDALRLQIRDLASPGEYAASALENSDVIRVKLHKYLPGSASSYRHVGDLEPGWTGDLEDYLVTRFEAGRFKLVPMIAGAKGGELWLSSKAFEIGDWQAWEEEALADGRTGSAAAAPAEPAGNFSKELASTVLDRQRAKTLATLDGDGAAGKSIAEMGSAMLGLVKAVADRPAPVAKDDSAMVMMLGKMFESSERRAESFERRAEAAAKESRDLFMLMLNRKDENPSGGLDRTISLVEKVIEKGLLKRMGVDEGSTSTLSGIAEIIKESAPLVESAVEKVTTAYRDGVEARPRFVVRPDGQLVPARAPVAAVTPEGGTTMRKNTPPAVNPMQDLLDAVVEELSKPAGSRDIPGLASLLDTLPYDADKSMRDLVDSYTEVKSEGLLRVFVKKLDARLLEAAPWAGLQELFDYERDEMEKGEREEKLGLTSN